jgi:hypothetical protein
MTTGIFCMYSWIKNMYWLCLEALLRMIPLQKAHRIVSGDAESVFCTKQQETST